MHYIQRDIESLFLQALKQFPILLVTGPRQSGKSTLIKHLMPDCSYVTFDDPLMRALATEDPELFLSRFPPPLLLDEIQYVPTLLPHLKMRVDQNRSKKGQYVLTGSEAFQLMHGVSETLAGRIAVLQLYPLSWHEISRLKNYTPFQDAFLGEHIVKGFYPEFFSTPGLNSYLWHSSYFATYIERDVRNIKSVIDLASFQKFVSLLAPCCGQLFNLSEIAKEVGVSQPTCKSWLSLLEATSIIYLLKPYHKNRTKRLVKSPKLYFVDSGLLCYLLGIENEAQFFKSQERGHLFENMVVMDAVKYFSAKSGRTTFSFWRTSQGSEVDLLIEREGTLSAYEIKCMKTITKEAATTVEEFAKEHKTARAAVISLNEKQIPLTSHVSAMHWSQL